MPDAVAHPTPPPRRAAARRARGAVLVGPLLVLAACSADAPATATTTSAATPVTTATPSTSPLPAAAMPTTTGRLVELLGRRLEIGVEVARTKWNTKAPIEDLAREATALDAIARAASHFGDKEGLFTAAVEARCEQQLPHGLFERPEGLSLRDALVAIGRAFTGLVHSEDAIQLMRMMVAQPGGSTRLATLYFAAGPKRALDEMEGFLRGVQASGQLAIGDPREAAGHFFMLLKGIVHMQVLIGLAPPPDAEARARHVERCVDFFLRAQARGP